MILAVLECGNLGGPEKSQRMCQVIAVDRKTPGDVEGRISKRNGYAYSTNDMPEVRQAGK